VILPFRVIANRESPGSTCGYLGKLGHFPVQDTEKPEEKMAEKPLRTEKPPAKEAPFPPAGGIGYKVKDGETWGSVANMFGLDVKKLIRFNFQTDDPGEVNWYLRVKVGCHLHDAINWKFSKEAAPGYIYHPAAPSASVPLTSPSKNPFDRLPPSRGSAARKRLQDWTVEITSKDADGDWIFNVFVGQDGKWFSDDPDVGAGDVDISDIAGSGGTALKAMGEKVLVLGSHKFIEREKDNNGIGSQGNGKFSLETKFGPRKFGARQNVKPDFRYRITDVPGAP
jgi:LysM repeat protein